MQRVDLREYREFTIPSSMRLAQPAGNEALRMSKTARLWLLLMLAGLLAVTAPATAMAAQQTHFSLAVGQSVTAGQYTVFFRGVIQGLPAYDLYFGSVLAARFPSPASLNGQRRYASGNVSIATTGLAQDGTAATGTITVK
jgi:hypothetical protein